MMNQEYQHSEMIEAYLRNELSEGQKNDFEELVRQDPLLYNEFALQQDIVSGLQTHRKNQLKSRLSQVDVSNPVQLGGVGVIGIWLAGATLVGLLGWLTYTGINGTKTPVSEIAIVQPVAEQAAPAPPQPAPVADPDAPAAGNTSEKVKTPKAPTPKVAARKRKNSITRSSQTPDAGTPTLAAGEAEQTLPGGGMSEVPAVKADSEVAVQEPPAATYNNSGNAQNRLNVVDNTNNRLKLHYYYQNGRIALLGFERGYTFLNVPAENITYLFYENNFYKLNQSQSRPAPIRDVLVTDAAVIESLRKLVEDRK